MNFSVSPTAWSQMFGVPNLVVDQYIKLATPSQLKVLLFVLRYAGQVITPNELSQRLGISEELADEALLFWQETALFKPDVQTAPTESPTVPPAQPVQPVSTAAVQAEPTPLPTSTAPTAKPIGSVQRSSAECKLTPKEIAQSIAESKDLHTLFRMAEQQIGRPLNHMEQRSLVWMHDYLGIGSDSILTVIGYCYSIQKTSIAYAEKLLTVWFLEESATTLPQVQEAIKRMEQQRTFQNAIMKAFQMNRKPTPKQQELLTLWQTMKIPMDLISYAYEKTIESIDKLSFPYINKILQSWNALGCRTREDVDRLDNKPSPKSKGNSDTTSSVEHADLYQSLVFNIDE